MSRTMTVVIKELNGRIERVKQIKRLVRAIGPGDWWGYRSGWYVTADADLIMFHPDTLEDMQEIRKLLRKQLGQWADSIVAMFENAGRGITFKWQSPVHNGLIQIIYAVDKLEDFPKHLLPSDNCVVAEVPAADWGEDDTKLRVTCPVGGA